MRLREQVPETRALPVLLLCRGMLDLAIRDAIIGFNNGKPTELSRDAMTWITNRGYEALSFSWCCLFLGVKPDEYRQQVLSDIWRMRLAMRENEAAIRGRFKAYSMKQTHQVRRPMENLPRRDRPGGFILAGAG